MKKFCIFCGEKPSDKTKEHVIPQWLIELTGDPKRLINVGNDWNSPEYKNRQFPFKHFQFPACNDCNTKYSHLESKTKPIVLKLLEGNSITIDETDVLLDWMDKVRIGLWLGYYLLDKNKFDINPHMAIDTRVRMWDRVLIIYKAEDQEKGVQFIGVNTPAFQMNPCCFTLVINNLYLFNLSKEFLLLRRVGFPFSKDHKLDKESDRIGIEMVAGSRRIMSPLLKHELTNGGFEIYQPIFNGLIKSFPDDELIKLFDNEYVRNHCLDWNNGIGSLFTRKSDGKITKVENGQEVSISNNKKYPRVILGEVIAMQTFRWQNAFLDLSNISMDYLTKEQKKYVKAKSRAAKRYNDFLLGVVDRKLKANLKEYKNLFKYVFALPL